MYNGNKKPEFSWQKQYSKRKRIFSPAKSEKFKEAPSALLHLEHSFVEC
jgi:hypothetical protein